MSTFTPDKVLPLPDAGTRTVTVPQTGVPVSLPPSP